MKYREREWQAGGRKRQARNLFKPLSQISPLVIKATLIAEDDKFWSHKGFDFEAMGKAMEKNWRQRKFASGGSTISQQLAKNLFLSPAKTPIRKIKEAILAWRLENKLSKRRIIELYLNYAEWGDGIFGIELAAQHYFGKSASDLDGWEAAQLAASLPNPRRFNPAGNSSFSAERAEHIHKIMLMRGIIPEYEEYQEVVKDEAPEPYITTEDTTE